MFERYYTVDIMDMDSDQEGALITKIQKATPIDSAEAIARAYEWLNEKAFLEFMAWWKYNDYGEIFYCNYDENYDHLIMAIQMVGSDENRIVWWEI